MPGRRELELSRDEIVRAAIEIFESDGLPAVSMRTVAARLGVSPVPVYRRVGNKDALLDAMAYHLLADVVPPLRPMSTGATTRSSGRRPCATGSVARPTPRC